MGVGPNRKSCIVCDPWIVEQFLSLGETALANNVFAKGELSAPKTMDPLRVGFRRFCGHVQLCESAPPNVMCEDYLYVFSASDTCETRLYGLIDSPIRDKEIL